MEERGGAGKATGGSMGGRQKVIATRPRKRNVQGQAKAKAKAKARKR